MITAEVHYRIPWRAVGSYPGHHASQQQGGGLQFRHHVPLINAPDPRRFDVRASLRDPFEQVQVRVYQQTSAIPVYVVADLSRSMGFGGAHSKMMTVADFVDALSYSAFRTGDRFGFIGCRDEHAQPLLLPLTKSRAAGFELAQSLRASQTLGNNAEGLRRVAEFLGRRRALVFLLSDFHLESALIEDVLSALAYHDVVPVILWDKREYENLPDFGFVRVSDPETGHSRMLLLRPGMRKRIAQRFAERRQALSALFTRYGRGPLDLLDGFVADEVTRYFFE